MTLSSRYDPQSIEEKWQKLWAERRIFACEPDSSRPKYYVLEMFPYPSGNIHMGHVRNYSIGDVVARFRRMQGYNVLHPMGGTRLAFPPRTRPSSTIFIPPNGLMPISTTCGRS